MSFTLPVLSYKYDALEPYLDKETMNLHHTKHHQTYINNANSALRDVPVFSNLLVDELIKKLDLLPRNIKNIIRNNAGGHINHSLFWTLLKKDTVLQGKLKDAIEHNFGSIVSFKEIFENVAVSHFGSGWVWLIKREDNRLEVMSTANQDNPMMISRDISYTYGYPIIGLDIWEHAYYLKYQNRRLDYVKSFWNILNWDVVSLRFEKSI